MKAYLQTNRASRCKVCKCENADEISNDLQAYFEMTEEQNVNLPFRPFVDFLNQTYGQEIDRSTYLRHAKRCLNIDHDLSGAN